MMRATSMIKPIPFYYISTKSNHIDWMKNKNKKTATHTHTHTHSPTKYMFIPKSEWTFCIFYLVVKLLKEKHYGICHSKSAFWAVTVSLTRSVRERWILCLPSALYQRKPISIHNVYSRTQRFVTLCRNSRMNTLNQLTHKITTKISNDFPVQCFLKRHTRAPTGTRSVNPNLNIRL